MPLNRNTTNLIEEDDLKSVWGTASSARYTVQNRRGTSMWEVKSTKGTPMDLDGSWTSRVLAERAVQAYLNGIKRKPRQKREPEGEAA